MNERCLMALPYCTKEVQHLFARHLRLRLVLADCIKAERDILSRIVAVMQDVPNELHDELVTWCVHKAATGLVYAGDR